MTKHDNGGSEVARRHWLPMPQGERLDIACLIIHQAFGHHAILVGSALDGRDFRDVDVRLVLPDDDFRAMFKHDPPSGNALWSLMCSSISAYLSDASGLPVDFQIQSNAWAEQRYADKKRRYLGFFVSWGSCDDQ